MTRLDDLTWQEVAAYQSLLLVVPVGATEQHGPHLPLSTDTDIAFALAIGLAERRDDVLVAPPFAYGSSGEHQDFAGTLSIGREAVELVIVELVRSARSSASSTLLVSAHGGNAEPIADAIRLLRSEGHNVRSWSPRWKGDAHAGHIETSVQLALDRTRVRSEEMTPGATEPLGTLMPSMVAHGVRAVSTNGVLGDPTHATAALGRELLEEAVIELETFVINWHAEVPKMKT